MNVKAVLGHGAAAGVALGAGAGLAATANAVDNSGIANKVITGSAAAAGIAGLGIAAKLRGSGNLEQAIFFSVISLYGGGASLAVAGGSLGVDLLDD